MSSSPRYVTSIIFCSAVACTGATYDALDEGVPEASPRLYNCTADGISATHELLRKLRTFRNAEATLLDASSLYAATEAIEQVMARAFAVNESQVCHGSVDGGAGLEACQSSFAPPHQLAQGVCDIGQPGNFHGVKSHAYYVGAISEAHPSLPFDAVQAIVGSEWYHPNLTAKAVWCADECGEQFPLARRLDANYEAIKAEVAAFWRHPDATSHLAGVGAHTTQFDRLIAGNGTWVDVRIWRGRAFDRHLCERHFRVICSIVEASPEIWTNPWSHVLLSVLLHDSWVPFHQGHTNAQLTYHFPVMVPRVSGSAELAVVHRGGTLPDDRELRSSMLTHPEERTVRWSAGKTLVFDDSFTHAVRFRAAPARQTAEPSEEGAGGSTADADGGGGRDEARVVLLMRGWHPELAPAERAALRHFVRLGGEEQPTGYELMPLPSLSTFAMGQ